MTVRAGGEAGGHCEERGGRRRRRARPVHDRQVAHQRRVEGDGAGPLCGGQHGDRLGHHRRPGTGQHQREDRLPLACLDRDKGTQPFPAEGGLEQPAPGAARRGHDQRDVRQAPRPQRAGRGGRARREYRNQLLPAERDGHQAVGGTAGVRDAHLRGAGPHLLGQFVGIARRGDVHRDRRVGLPVGAEQRGQRVGRQGGQRGQVKTPSAQLVDLGGDLAGRVDLAQHRPGRADQRRPGVRQLHSPAQPVEQRAAELGLQLGDRLGQGGLGNVHRLRGAGEPGVLDHGEEQAQPPDVERRHPVTGRCRHVRTRPSCS